MRRMISDKQLNELKSKNLKIIKFDTPITQATITQEQLDILFPKDEQGNIHAPDYDIVIIGGGVMSEYGHLVFWNSMRIIFSRFAENDCYTWIIGPNDNKFTETYKWFATEEYVNNLIINSLNGDY